MHEGRPHCFVGLDDLHVCYAPRGATDAIHWHSPAGGALGRPSSGERIGLPAAVAFEDCGTAKVHVSVIGLQDFEHHARSWDGSGWGAWQSLGSPPTTPP